MFPKGVARGKHDCPRAHKSHVPYQILQQLFYYIVGIIWSTTKEVVKFSIWTFFFKFLYLFSVFLLLWLLKSTWFFVLCSLSVVYFIIKTLVYISFLQMMLPMQHDDLLHGHRLSLNQWKRTNYTYYIIILFGSI